MAVTTDGSVLVNVAYVGDLRTVEEVVALLKGGRVVGNLFVGVALDRTGTKAASKRLDDAAAEIAATCGLKLRAGKRRQR